MVGKSIADILKLSDFNSDNYKVCNTMNKR